MTLKISPGPTKMAQVTSTGCSSRVLRFNSQHSNDGSQFVTPVPGDLTLF